MQRDAHPLTRGHRSVTPSRHAARLFECAAEERMAMPALLDAVQALIDRELAPDGYNLGRNNGKGAAAPDTVLCGACGGGVRWIFPQRAAYRAQDES